MAYNGKLEAALAKCEATSKAHGHSLGRWRQTSELMYTSICVLCEELAWVILSGHETHWRIGGTALEKDCLEEDLQSPSRE